MSTWLYLITSESARKLQFRVKLSSKILVSKSAFSRIVSQLVSKSVRGGGGLVFDDD